MPDHPMQPIVLTPSGVVRFQRNEAVKYLLDNGGIDLAYLNMRVMEGEIPEADFMQLMQLIGYSVSGYGDLAMTSSEEWQASADAADEIAARVWAERAAGRPERAEKKETPDA